MKTFFTARRLLFFKFAHLGRSLAVLGALFISAGILSAQTPQIEWIRQFGTLVQVSDQATAVDALGNVYVVGYTNGALPGQPIMSKGSFIRKIDSAGNEIWTREFAYSDNPYCYGFADAVSTDPQGNVCVAGYVTGALPGQTSSGNYDAFVRKYDGDGNELWTRQFGSADIDDARDVYTDSTGVYVAGITLGALPGQTKSSAKDGFLRKYDSDGNEVWTRQFGDAYPLEANGISADSTGIYIAGFYTYAGGPAGDSFVRKYDTNGNLLWTHLLFINTSFRAMDISASADGIFVAGLYPSAGSFVCKLDSSGTELWTRSFGNSFGYSIQADYSGIYISGTAYSALPGQTYYGSADAYVRKYDAGGNIIWTQQFGTNQYDCAPAVSADSQGIYVAGYTEGTFPGQVSSGMRDAYVRKYDTGGNEIWTHQFGGVAPATDIVYGIDTQGNIYMAGAVGGPLPGQTNTGSIDAFIRKYDAAGNEIWTRQFGTSAYDIARAICTDSSGIYLAGTAGGTLPGQSSPNGAFIRKYDGSGNDLWTRQFSNAAAYAVSRDVDGNIYVAGTASAALPGQTSAGGYDAFVRKYNSTGSEVWTRQFGSPSEDQAMATCVDLTGVYVAGYTAGILPGQAGSGVYDSFICKYDFNGLELWTVQFGTTGYDNLYAMCADPTGAYLTGYTSGIFPGQTGGNTFVRKYDPNGCEIWAGQFWADTYAISGYSDGIIVAGTKWGAFPGQTSAGGYDAYIRQYDSSGIEVRTFQFGTSATDYAGAVAADSQGIYVGGYTYGTFPGQPSIGNGDAFIAKIRFNAPPVANAGPDQEIEATGQTTSFSLDGSGSSDPDGDVLTYKWEDTNGNVVGESSIVTLERTLGTYTFKLTVKDPGNMSSEDNVTITIHDTTPPSLTAPADLTVDQSDPYGTPVTLGNPTVSDIFDPSPTVVKYAPDLFPLGETVVTWTATDASGNVATAQQKVTVVPGSPANQLSNLTKLILYSVAAGTIDPELETSLLAKVAAASDALAKANPSAATVAMNDLKALVNQVEAQTDKKITPAIAAEIIAWANGVITSLGG